MLQRFLDWDARFSRRLRVAERPGLLRTLAAVFAHSGDSWFWFAGLALVGWQAAALRRCAAVLFVSAFVTAALVLALKFTFRRRRPEGEWGAIYRTTDPHSFPSGHAARATLLAAVSWGVCPLGAAVALTVWAPLVSLARVAMGVHYVSDVLAGIAVGLLMGGLTLALAALV